jgi:hypothetical protein
MMIVVGILSMTILIESIEDMLQSEIGAGIIVDKNANNKQIFKHSSLQDRLNRRGVGCVLNMF